MPKRKLSEISGPARPDARKQSMKSIRLAHKFEQGVQLISKSLKTARGFERQKLSRREKTAKAEGNSATLSRLAEEVEALKGIEYHVTADNYLFKQLSKIKRVAESPAFKEFQESRDSHQTQLKLLEEQKKRRVLMARQEQASKATTDGQPPMPGQEELSSETVVSMQTPKSTAEANVLARLFKSNPVRNVMPGILGDIRKLLGLEETPAGKQSKPGNRKDETAKAKAARPQHDESESEPEGEQQVKRSSKKQDQDSGANEDVEGSGDEGSESEDFSQFDSRLAPGSDSEDEGDEGVSDEDMPSADNGTAAADDMSDSVSRSLSPTFSAEASPPPKKPKGAKTSTAPAQSTTFLPSLMMGGYWSGSEEASEDDAAGPPKRKNRMGQQARRALWEKKYGAKANHVQQEKKQQKRNRDSGWDTRRGATDSGGGRGGRHGGRGGSSADGGRPQKGRDGRAGQSHGGKPMGPQKETGPLHPSWEAKRKLKEQTSTAAFQGKKVVFD